MNAARAPGGRQHSDQARSIEPQIRLKSKLFRPTFTAVTEYTALPV